MSRFSLSLSPVSPTSFGLSLPDDVIGLRSDMIDEEVAVEESFTETLSSANDKDSLMLCANNCIKAMSSQIKMAEASHCISYTYYYILFLFSRNN